MTRPCRMRMAETGKRLEFATSNGKFYAGAEALQGMENGGFAVPGPFRKSWNAFSVEEAFFFKTSLWKMPLKCCLPGNGSAGAEFPRRRGKRGLKPVERRQFSVMSGDGTGEGLGGQAHVQRGIFLRVFPSIQGYPGGRGAFLPVTAFWWQMLLRRPASSFHPGYGCFSNGTYDP